MIGLTEPEFLRRIKLEESNELIWIAVDAFYQDKYYIAQSNGCLTALDEMKYKHAIRTLFEELIQTGEMDYSGYRKPIGYDTSGNLVELYNVNDIKYVRHACMRETTAETPRHIKLGFMQL